MRDQFLIFHPLVLLWDLKRIQLFLSKVQSYQTYSIVLVDSRHHIREAISLYLEDNYIPKSICQLLQYDYPGSVTNQYYMNTQSKTQGSLITRQIIVFFDYFLNKQFYNESIKIPSVRFSLYSLHNIPNQAQYNLPSKSGVLLAIRLLLKLLLQPFISTQLPSTSVHNNKELLVTFTTGLPVFNALKPKKATSLKMKQRITSQCRGTPISYKLAS